jgi:hypothetical protein
MEIPEQPAAGDSSSTALKGSWVVEPSKQTGQVKVKLERSSGGRRSSNSTYVPATSLQGWTPSLSTSTTRERVRLLWRRDAGTFRLEGFVQSGKGSGTLTFDPDGEFAGELRRMGYADVDDEKLYLLASHDVGRAFIAELAAEYPRTTLDELVQMSIFGVDGAFIRALKELGYDHLKVDRLVGMRIHGVSPEFIRSLCMMGYKDLSLDQLVGMRIHGVTPEFIESFRPLGYFPLPVDKLVGMRIHGVTPEFVTSLNKIGYKNLPLDQLVGMRIRGISPELIAELKDLGYDHLPVEQLITMRIHGVSPEYIRSLQQAGWKGAPVGEMVKMRIHGIRPPAAAR